MALQTNIKQRMYALWCLLQSFIFLAFYKWGREMVVTGLLLLFCSVLLFFFRSLALRTWLSIFLVLYSILSLLAFWCFYLFFSRADHLFAIWLLLFLVPIANIIFSFIAAIRSWRSTKTL